jgi:hypothetical protein
MIYPFYFKDASSSTHLQSGNTSSLNTPEHTPPHQWPAQEMTPSKDSTDSWSPSGGTINTTISEDQLFPISRKTLRTAYDFIPSIKEDRLPLVIVEKYCPYT